MVKTGRREGYLKRERKLKPLKKEKKRMMWSSSIRNWHRPALATQNDLWE